MPASGERGNSERLCMIPVLRTCRQDKWQPMCRDCRVKKSHRESRDRDGCENCLVHIRKKCGKNLSASPLRTKLSGWWDLNPRPVAAATALPYPIELISTSSGLVISLALRRFGASGKAFTMD